jgi:hypothetical protein
MAQVERKTAAALLPTSFLRWEDALVSTAFAYAAALLLLTIVLLWPQDISSFDALFLQVWRDWSVWLGTGEMQPVYITGVVSSICLAAAAAACAVVLTRQYFGRRELGS